MSLRHVVIVSPPGLFRAGLKHFLGDVAQVTLVTSLAEVTELVRTQDVDAVIVDQANGRGTDSDLMCHLLSYPNMRVITVNLLDARELQVYQHDQLVEVSAEALIAAIMHS